MSNAREDPVNQFTIPFQLTKTMHRKVPDDLQAERPENSQKGKIIVITGAGTGIGAATAKVWVRAGAEGVVIVGRRKEKLEQTVKDLETVNKGPTKILAVGADVTVDADMKRLYKEVIEAFGRTADVVMANAAVVSAMEPSAEADASEWWKPFVTNVLGLHHTVSNWIKSQPDPKKPVGTVINITSGAEGTIIPGMSAYSPSKLAGHRYMEYLAVEYNLLRTFTLMPGLVHTDGTDPMFIPFSVDEAEQTGAMALYLASSRADYLKGSITSINWDVGEMEARKEDIEKGMLKLSWVPVLPVSGGSGI